MAHNLAVAVSREFVSLMKEIERSKSGGVDFKEAVERYHFLKEIIIKAAQSGMSLEEKGAINSELERFCERRRRFRHSWLARDINGLSNLIFSRRA